MFASILAILAPILIRCVGWFIDYLGAKDQTKKQFYLFVSAWENDRGTSVKLSQSARAQLDRIKDEIAQQSRPPQKN